MPKTAHSTVADPSDLEGLLASCHRNGRLPKFPTKEPKIYFDADRFRWWFRYGCSDLYSEVGGVGPTFKGFTLQKIRDWMDARMREHPEQVHQ